MKKEETKEVMQSFEEQQEEIKKYCEEHNIEYQLNNNYHENDMHEKFLDEIESKKNIETIIEIER